MLNYFYMFIDCSSIYVNIMSVLVFMQKFNQFIVGMFLVLVIHFLAKQSQKANDIDYSSQYESEEMFFNRKDSWTLPRGSIKQMETSDFSETASMRKSIEY